MLTNRDCQCAGKVRAVAKVRTHDRVTLLIMLDNTLTTVDGQRVTFRRLGASSIAYVQQNASAYDFGEIRKLIDRAIKAHI